MIVIARRLRGRFEVTAEQPPQLARPCADVRPVAPELLQRRVVERAVGFVGRDLVGDLLERGHRFDETLRCIAHSGPPLMGWGECNARALCGLNDTRSLATAAATTRCGRCRDGPGLYASGRQGWLRSGQAGYPVGALRPAMRGRAIEDG